MSLHLRELTIHDVAEDKRVHVQREDKRGGGDREIARHGDGLGIVEASA